MTTLQRDTTLDPVPADDLERWVQRAVAELLDLWRRRGVAYARRLERAHRFREPADDVLALGARRLLPLEQPVRRPLPSAALALEERAWQRLAPADRAMLWDWRDGEAHPGRRLARAAALQRLTQTSRAARRMAGTPPVGSREG